MSIEGPCYSNTRIAAAGLSCFLYFFLDHSQKNSQKLLSIVQKSQILNLGNTIFDQFILIWLHHNAISLFVVARALKLSKIKYLIRNGSVEMLATLAHSPPDCRTKWKEK